MNNSTGILRTRNTFSRDSSQRQYLNPTFKNANRSLNSASSQRHVNMAAAVNQQNRQQSAAPGTRGSHQNLNLSRKMVRVINGKIIPAPDQEDNQQQSLRSVQSQQNFSHKHNGSSQITADNVESIIGRNSVSALGNRPQTSTQECSVAGKSAMENEVDSFINYNEVYYKHVKGLCVCYHCTCGKHRCAFAKNSHLKQPFNAPPAKSIYKINYVGKQGPKDVGFDYGMYENMRSNMKPIDHKSINHKDYTKPDMDSYGATKNFKPTQHYEANPLEVGRSHYKRDFLEWGCVPYQPIKGYSQRTTIDAMPFHGQTTYTKDFYKMDPQKQKVDNKNHTTTMVKSPIPFLGITTSKDAYKAYKQPEPAVRFKASDELVTGAPSFQGQYNSLHNKDFINFSNICPVEKMIKSGTVSTLS